MVCVFTFRKLLAVAVILLTAQTGSLLANPAAATIVIYNSNDPTSLELALYYAIRRNIPIARVLGLDCPTTEEISREDFNTKIATPLRKQFLAARWWDATSNSDSQSEITKTRIRFVAIIRGIPLKITHDRLIGPARHLQGMAPVVLARNDSSVDSEIAALGLPDFTPAGLILNPYFDRFTPILEDSMPAGLLLPCRLDAPTPETVRRMIDDSLATEKIGLWGWAYIDSRNLTSPSDGGYVDGDNWLRGITRQLRQRGMPVILDKSSETLPPDFPITDAALYYGWYAPEANGPFLDEDFKFRPGAIAVHLHSFSAATLRSISANWCGPLLELGAAATLGNVYEPYLVFTSHLSIFQDRLMNGFTLAEAGYMSQRSLSWAGVIIGDPLYRPFAAWDHFFDHSTAISPWREFRQITSTKNILDAVLPLHEAARRTRNSMFLEALGAAQMDAGHESAAVHSFRSALKLASSPTIASRLRKEIAAIEDRSEDQPPEAE